MFLAPGIQDKVLEELQHARTKNGMNICIRGLEGKGLKETVRKLINIGYFRVNTGTREDKRCRNSWRSYKLLCLAGYHAMASTFTLNSVQAQQEWVKGLVCFACSSISFTEEMVHLNSQ